jgi:hypothetical protein
MVQFEIENNDKFDLILYPKRNLTIQVIHTDHLPTNLPETAMIVFGTGFEQVRGKPIAGLKSVVTAFCILNPQDIKYEASLTGDLISNAIEYYSHNLGVKYKNFEFTPLYKKTYIDTDIVADIVRTKSGTPEMLAYFNRPKTEERLDFYDWREKHKSHQ